MKTVLIVAACILGMGLGPAKAGDGDLQSRLKHIRKEFKAVEKAVAKKRYRISKITIGGGQNPNEILVHYAGGREADYEKDPCAAPFRLRRVRVNKMLPAVGGSTETLYFDSDGELFFAFNTGVDTVGTPYALMPVGQIRLYFHKGQLIRVIVNGLSGEGEDKKTVDLATASGEDKKKAAAAGKAVLARARALVKALKILSE